MNMIKWHPFFYVGFNYEGGIPLFTLRGRNNKKKKKKIIMIQPNAMAYTY